MYPNSALPAGELAIIAVVAIISLAIWIGGVFVAAREPRRRDSHAAAVALPPRRSDAEESRSKAA